MGVCSRCGAPKESTRGRKWCDVCRSTRREHEAAQKRAERQRHAEHYAESKRRFAEAHPDYNRDYLRLYHTGLTRDQYETLLVAQGGVCAICRQPETKRMRGGVVALSADHDHSCCDRKRACGKCVRGLLCSRCNRVLGEMNDDIGLLASAIAYLEGGR